jgi:CBS domain-containing protein
MSEPVVTVEVTTTVRQAANLMRGHSIGCLVVTGSDRSGRVKGIVTVSDLLELVGRGLDRGAATSKRWTLKHRTPHRKVSVPTGTW